VSKKAVKKALLHLMRRALIGFLWERTDAEVVIGSLRFNDDV